VPRVHSTLPSELAEVVGNALAGPGIEHIAHGEAAFMAAAEAAAADPQALALIGPYRSRAVADAVAETAPAGLPLLAPVATWAGVTRDDEPGCEDDPADHQGTVFRMVARDTEVAARLAADVRAARQRAQVVAGDHEYGAQIDGQLRLAGLPRADESGQADLVVLAGLAGEAEIAVARDLAPLPVVAFDGAQGADLGDDRQVALVLPFAPSKWFSPAEQFLGLEAAARAAGLVVRVDCADRQALLEYLRRSEFDVHGDPLHAPVWLWRRTGPDWSLTPDRALPEAA
jgi:hypothetical protein